MSMQDTYNKVKTYYMSAEYAIKEIVKFINAFNDYSKHLVDKDKFIYRKEHLELCKMRYNEIAVFYLRKTGETHVAIEIKTSSSHTLGDEDNLTMDELMYIIVNIRQFILDAITEVMKQETKNMDELVDYFKEHVLDML